jgi:hypothetical protein
MTVAAIHQPQYLPYLGFFHKLAHCDVFVVLDDVQFQRGGLQNRNRIKTSAGCKWLTVPVTQNSHQALREVRINPTYPWQRKHVNALQQNYGRAPYFDPHGPDVVTLLQRPWENLTQLNMSLTNMILGVLGINRTIVYSSDLRAPGQRSDLLVNLCRAVGATSYLSGPGGRRYLDVAAFDRSGIQVIWQDFTCPTYAQMFPDLGFIADLSIVDVLLCCGPDTAMFLKE